jgi:uncharacterized protein YjbI with pentapeptide repeats
VAALAPDLTEPVTGIAHVLIAQRRPQDALAVLAEAEGRLGPHREFSAARSVARLALGEHEDLQRLDLRGADLSGIDLSRRDLRGVDFSGTFLASVDLRQSDLRGTRFVGTRFDQVRMERANLEGATFTATIGFPKVEGANLSRARLDRIVLRRHLSLVDVDLEGANIVESRFRDVILQGTRMRGANLSTVYVQGGLVVAPDFAGATLRNVTLVGVALDSWVGGRPLQAQDLLGARLINVRFE